jgi:hypothetical protein
LFSSIEKTRDGGYVVSAATEEDSQPPLDALVIKLDKNLAVEWGNAYGGPFGDVARHVSQIHDDGFVLVGQTQRGAGQSSCALVMRLGGRGGIIWARDWPDRTDCLDADPLSVEVTKDDFIAVGEVAHAPTPSIYNGLILRVEGNGTIDAHRPPKIVPYVAFPGSENATGIQLSTITRISRGFLISGITNRTGPDSPVGGTEPNQPMIIKLSPNASLEDWNCPAIEDANFDVRDASNQINKRPLDWSPEASHPSLQPDLPIEHPEAREVIINFTRCADRTVAK